MTRPIGALSAACLILSATPASADDFTEIFVASLSSLGFIMIGGLYASGADEDGDYDRSGFYAEVGATYAFNTFQDDLQSAVDSVMPGFDTRVNNSFGVDGRIGYRILPWLAAEGEFGWVNGFRIDARPQGTPGVGWTSVLETETFTGTVNAKGFFLKGPYQPYAFAGLGAMHLRAEDEVGLGVTEDSTDLAFRFGAGMDFYAAENFAFYIDASYLLPTGDLEDFDYVSLAFGVQYRF